MQRVLLLSRDPLMRQSVEAATRSDGRQFHAVDSVEDCLVVVRDWRPVVVVVDGAIGLTAGGFAALLRDEAVATTAGVIAAVSPAQLALVGAGSTVADFVLAPVDEQELRTRIARVIWTRTGAGDGSVIQHGSLRIDIERYKVTVDGDVVDLTYKEFELLRFLASNAGKPFTREALLNQVWGYDYYGGSRTVDVHIRRIRAKIEQREQYIDTVRNVGYRFIEVGTASRSLDEDSEAPDESFARR